MSDAFGEAAEVPAPQPPPAAPEPEQPPKVTLACVWPLEELQVPPLVEGGPTVVITGEGTEVDADTADRAWLAAHLAGHQLKEI